MLAATMEYGCYNGRRAADDGSTPNCLPRRTREHELAVPDFSSSRRGDGVNGDNRKPDSL